MDAPNGRRVEPAVRLWVDSLCSPVGDVIVVTDARRLCAVDFGDFRERMEALLARRFAAYELVPTRDPLGACTLLEAYFRADAGADAWAALDALPTTTGGTAYQQRVWQALRSIPAGRTRAYGELAADLGATHARAVGHANSLNPIAIVLPCHRVVGAGGALTGYAGGLARKQWLLDHERRLQMPHLPFVAHR